MINKNKKYFFFLILFLFLSYTFLPVMAQDVTFTPQIGIPDSKFKVGEGVAIDGGGFIDYMSAIYEWAVGAIAIIAVIMIMIAGFQWMTAAGNASAIGQAKSRISSSLIGLLLAVGAYSLLNFINPSLVHLRSLDLQDIENVDLNISEEVCYDGKTSYRWSNYICFSIINDGSSQDFFPLLDFGMEEAIEKQDIKEIKIDLGVDDNYDAQCDSSNDFEAIGVEDTITLSETQLSSSNPWFGCLHNDSAGDFCLTFDDTVANGGAIIKVKADFNSSDVLSGFSFITANKSAGKASAYFRNIKVITNLSCLTCCGRNEEASYYKYDIECAEGYNKLSLDRCDNKFCDEDCSRWDNRKDMCTAVAERCPNGCSWNQGEYSCQSI